MRGNARLLVVGPAALGGEVSRALPRFETASTDSPLSGLWRTGHEEFDGVIISLSLGRRALQAIRGLRQVAPQVRIVATCSPAEEPRAREAIQAGADEYVLEPVQAEDLKGALHIAAAPEFVARDIQAASLHEIVQLSEILKNLSEGPQRVLDRLAALVQAAFEADSVTIQIDDLASRVGTAGPAVLQEPIRRQETIVGGIAVGQRASGAYDAADASQLINYARLTEAIMAQATEQSRWQDLAWHDDLSGLHNRRYFDATLSQLIEQAMSQRLRLTVILFDIDNFKSYNDHYGHDTGDALIREVAILLTRCSRESDVVARYGGDEFTVILWDAEQPRVPGSQHPTTPLELADRFCKLIGGHNFKCLGPDAPGPVTISGGLACFPWDGKTREELMRAADDALLAAKRIGKNRIALANGAHAASNGDESEESSEDARPSSAPSKEQAEPD